MHFSEFIVHKFDLETTSRLDFPESTILYKSDGNSYFQIHPANTVKQQGSVSQCDQTERITANWGEYQPSWAGFGIIVAYY